MNLNIFVNIKHGFVREIKDLSGAKQTLLPALEAFGAANANMNPIAQRILSDLVLSAKLLRNCNTAPSGRLATVGSFSSALQQLGFETNYRIIRSANGAYVIKEIGVEELA